MNIKSEKVIYAKEFSDESHKFETGIFIWGEDLIDKKLILFPKKLKLIDRYEDIRDNLRQCAVVIIDKNKEKYFHFILTSTDTVTGNVYFSITQFNSMWKNLRNSVNVGIQLANEIESSPIKVPEDILVFDQIKRIGSTPVIKNYRLEYKQRELTEEERFKNARKQSLFDNQKMIYFYSDDSKYYHDKDCVDVAKISVNDIKASDVKPNKLICPKCKRKLCVRIACYPNTKQIPICYRILGRQNVPTKLLYHFVMKAKFKFHATSFDELWIKSPEDEWVVAGLNDDKLVLWHNNYINTAPNERYVTNGFHKQNVEDLTLVRILNYIEHHTSKPFETATENDRNTGEK